MLKLKREQIEPFKQLQANGRDNALSALYGHGLDHMAHGEWTGVFAPLNSIKREELAIAIATGRYEVEKTPLEKVHSMIMTYHVRSMSLEGREKDLCQDIVTELRELEKSIKSEEGTE